MQKLTWIHFVEWAAGWHRVDRRKSALDLPSIAPDQQIDQYLTPFQLNNFPLRLSFQFFHWLIKLSEAKLWRFFFYFFEFQKMFLQTLLCSKFEILMPKLLLRVRKFSRTHWWCFVVFFVAAAAASFLSLKKFFFLSLVFLNHFQGYLTRKNSSSCDIFSSEMFLFFLVKNSFLCCFCLGFSRQTDFWRFLWWGKETNFVTDSLNEF